MFEKKNKRGTNRVIRNVNHNLFCEAKKKKIEYFFFNKMNLVYILNHKDICTHCSCKINNKKDFVRNMYKYENIFINVKIYKGHEKCGIIEAVSTVNYMKKKNK